MYNINKNKILELYYESHLKRGNISKKLKISTSYITRIVKSDSRYETEKQIRKETTKAEKAKRTKEYIKEKREIVRNEQSGDFLQLQHNRAVSELSENRSSISNRVLRKWCAGAYNYNNRKKGFEFDKTIGQSYAMPTFIKME